MSASEPGAGIALPSWSAEQRAAQARAIALERYAAHFEPLRTASSFASLLAMCAGLWALTLIPSVSRFLHVTPRQMGLAMGVQSVGIAIATWSARYGGVLGRLHRALERIETAIGALVGAYLIHATGNAATILWLIPISQILLQAPDVLHAVFGRWVGSLALCGTGAAFALEGKSSDALMTVFFATVIFWVAQARERSSRAFLDVLVDRNLLRDQLQGVLVAQERQRIARDLHDGLGAELAALAWSASNLAADEASADRRVSELAEQARATLHELRQVALGLSMRDMPIEELRGLLEASCTKLVGASSTLSIVAEGEVRLRGETCAQLSLFVREAVRNAVTHGRPSRIAVALRWSDVLEVSVVDDGIGVDARAAATSTGGLRYMKERARTLGGELTIAATQPGTSITLRVPKHSAAIP